LFEIVDPKSGEVLPEGEAGEVVVTTLDRQAMPLIRYRTGDLARLVTSPCRCGGVTARLCDIAGRGRAVMLHGGFCVTSQDLDDRIFDVEGLLDYRATLAMENGRERLDIEYLAGAGHDHLERQVADALARVPALAVALELGTLVRGSMRRVETFSPSHTVKRSLADQRGSTP
jgi:phenylacetate-coenzyme A ligase PaaK-like adenylate-forming protein